MNRYTKNRYTKFSIIVLMLIVSIVLIGWTTNTGSILFTGPTVFTAPMTAGDVKADTLSLTSAAYAFATTTPNDTYSVAGVSTVFLDSTSSAGTIGGLTGGVANQHIYFSVIDATETITIENAEGGAGQDLNLDGAADVTLNVNEGMHLICDGSDWWEIRR